MLVEQRKALPYMHPGRADVIGAGGLILDRILRRTTVSSMLVSEHDILDGIAWSLASPITPADGKDSMFGTHEDRQTVQPSRRSARPTGVAPSPTRSESPRPARDRRTTSRGRSASALRARRTVREFRDDGGTDLAAALTYYSVLAIFPGLIALMALVGVFGQAQESVDKIMEILAPLVSGDTHERIEEPARRARHRPRAPGLALVIGRGRRALVGLRLRRGVQPRDEPHLRGRGGPAVLADAADAADRHGHHRAAVRAALVILIVSGPVAESVGSAIGVGDDLVVVWDCAKWPVLAVVVMVVVALLYCATPNVEFTRFRVISVGAVRGDPGAGWSPRSGFAFYVANFGSYNKTYGSIAGVVVALLWLWITNVALLFGAELDAELERGRELQIGIAAEEALQLPVRDTRGIQKAAARQAEDVAGCASIRLAAAGPGDPDDRPFGRR